METTAVNHIAAKKLYHQRWLFLQTQRCAAFITFRLNRGKFAHRPWNARIGRTCRASVVWIPHSKRSRRQKRASRLKRHSSSFVKKIASALLGNRGRRRRAGRNARARRATHKDVVEHQCHEHNKYQKKQSAHGGVLFAANLPFLLRNQCSQLLDSGNWLFQR